MKTLLLLGALTLTACVSGPKDNRTALEKLNGESYETPRDVMGVPVLTRKPIPRQFSGRVFCGEGLSQSPANHAKIALLKGDATVVSTFTDIDGSYILLSPIEPETSYRLRAGAKCGTSDRTLDPKEALGLSQADFVIR